MLTHKELFSEISNISVLIYQRVFVRIFFIILYNFSVAVYLRAFAHFFSCYARAASFYRKS